MLFLLEAVRHVVIVLTGQSEGFEVGQREVTHDVAHQFCWQGKKRRLHGECTLRGEYLTSVGGVQLRAGTD
jgi:hypothetical protein